MTSILYIPISKTYYI